MPSSESPQLGLTVEATVDFHHRRITHYDPKLREAGWDFGPASWISVSDVGHEFGGVVLTNQAYCASEDAHVAAVVAFAEEAGVFESEVRDGEHGVPPDGSRMLSRIPIARSQTRPCSDGD